VLPLVLLVTGPFAAKGTFSPPTDAGIPSPLYRPAVAALRPAAMVVDTWLPMLTTLGLLLLYLRYRRAVADSRRRIRWLLFGALIAMVCYFAMTAVSLSPARRGRPSCTGLFGLTGILIGSLTVALSGDGVLGVSRGPRLWCTAALARRSLGCAAGAASATPWPLPVVGPSRSSPLPWSSTARPGRNRPPTVVLGARLTAGVHQPVRLDGDGARPGHLLPRWPTPSSAAWACAGPGPAGLVATAAAGAGRRSRPARRGRPTEPAMPLARPGLLGGSRVGRGSRCWTRTHCWPARRSQAATAVQPAPDWADARLGDPAQAVTDRPARSQARRQHQRIQRPARASSGGSLPSQQRCQDGSGAATTGPMSRWPRPATWLRCSATCASSRRSPPAVPQGAAGGDRGRPPAPIEVGSGQPALRRWVPPDVRHAWSW
jgi:hypothetical protein